MLSHYCDNVHYFELKTDHDIDSPVPHKHTRASVLWNGRTTCTESCAELLKHWTSQEPCHKPYEERSAGEVHSTGSPRSQRKYD